MARSLTQHGIPGNPGPAQTFREGKESLPAPRLVVPQKLPKLTPHGQVIIVGAGPSGLILAILLAQHSIPSLVLEAWPHLDTRLRATQYGVPATRVFRRAGILDDVRARSIPSFPTITWRRVEDHGKLVAIDMTGVADHPDRMTVIPLGELVTVMYRHCCAEKYAGLVEVRFEHRVVEVGQDEGRGAAWVDVDVGPEKRRERFEADYVLGCDGASSGVRKSLFGHEWPGETFDQKIVVQNVRCSPIEEKWGRGLACPTGD